MKCGGKPGGGNDARRTSLRDSLRAWKSLRDSHIPTARLLLYSKNLFPKGAFLAACTVPLQAHSWIRKDSDTGMSA